MSRLRLLDDKDVLQLFDLAAGGVFGREPEVEFIVDHPTVSRRHARFIARDGEFEVQDLGSANGTSVNGRALDSRPHLLVHGDQLQFGALQASFHSTLVEAETTLKRGPAAKGSRAATVTTGNVLEQQLLLGRLAQRRMLIDRPPQIPGYELGHLLLPAMGVGGDFICWGHVADGRHALVIGDVCGKGVPAALYMAYASGLLVEILATARNAADVLQRANGRLQPIMEPGMFVTAFAMLVDPKQHQVELACAGHVPAVLKLADGSVSDISMPPGLPLGLGVAADIGSIVIELAVGDVLTALTDGVDEAKSAEGEEFGRWRILDTVARSSGAIDVARRLHAAVNRHANRTRQHDDITVVTLERCE